MVTLYMPSNSARTSLDTAMSPSLLSTSTILRCFWSKRVLVLTPSAVTCLPSARVATSFPGAARISLPWVETRAGMPAAPISISRPQTPIVCFLSVTGVHGEITFSMLPRDVFHHSYFLARSSLAKVLSRPASTFPSFVRHSRRTVQAPIGRLSKCRTALA